VSAEKIEASYSFPEEPGEELLVFEERMQGII
jgi:hypothetical protein